MPVLLKVFIIYPCVVFSRTVNVKGFTIKCKLIFDAVVLCSSVDQSPGYLIFPLIKFVELQFDVV